MPFATLENWWKGVPYGEIPVMVKKASFSFETDGPSKTLPYKVMFP